MIFGIYIIDAFIGIRCRKTINTIDTAKKKDYSWQRAVRKRKRIDMEDRKI